MYAKHFTVALLALTLMMLQVSTANAQRRDRERGRRQAPREKEAKAPEPTGFKSKLWYGGGVNIGFGAFNGFSSLNLGLSPMIGYKIAKPLSVGPRLAYDFTSLKQRGFPSINLHSFDVGAFMRYRVFMGLFFQGEISNQWYQDIDYFITGEKIGLQRFNQRLGAGWNFGDPGGAGSEISILYNFKVANDLNTAQNPIEYRFGFTWRF